MGELETFGTSKSRVGQRFLRQMEAKLREHLSRRLDDLNAVALLVDGVRIDEWTGVVALGVDAEGRQHVLGLREGATENEATVRSLLEDRVERGLRDDQGLLVVIDGAKALRAAVRAVFGKQALVQRCTVHSVSRSLEAVGLGKEGRPAAGASMRKPMLTSRCKSGPGHRQGAR